MAVEELGSGVGYRSSSAKHAWCMPSNFLLAVLGRLCKPEQGSKAGRSDGRSPREAGLVGRGSSDSEEHSGVFILDNDARMRPKHGRSVSLFVLKGLSSAHNCTASRLSLQWRSGEMLGRVQVRAQDASKNGAMQVYRYALAAFCSKPRRSDVRALTIRAGAV